MKHCWHSTGVIHQTTPEQVEETCCWCGKPRLRIRGRAPLEGHGPFTGGWYPCEYETCPERTRANQTQYNQPRCNRTLHHRGGIFPCMREMGHEPDGHRFELPDVDTRIKED